MKKLIKGFGVGLLSILTAVALFFFGTRFTDGPLAIFTGGQFTSGVLEDAPEDWSYLKDRDLIEFQTLTPARSRTVWLAVHDSRLFIVSGYMNTGYGGIWKQWPHYLSEDDRIILRIDGALYEQRLERIMEGPQIVPVLKELSRKYFGGAQGLGTQDTVTRGDTWMYEVIDR